MAKTQSTKQSEANANFSSPNIATAESKAEFFKGVVQSYDPSNGLYLVKNVSSAKNSTLYCIYVSGLISMFVGLRINAHLEPGTPVIGFKNNNAAGTAYIIGALPSGDITDELYNNTYTGYSSTSETNKALLDSAVLSNENGIKALDGSLPADLAPGEASIQLGSGSAVQLLHTFARLKASDLAAIECYVQDDMVRILNKTFQHFNAFGEQTIYNENGSLNVVWKGTSKEYESFGKESEGDLGLGTAVSGYNPETVEDPSEEFNEDGRWRFVNYIGELGHFIHLFIQDPQKHLDTEDQTPNTGRCSFHINEDGSVLCQSLSDIAFEKVVRISVPKEKKRWEESQPGKKPDYKYTKNWTKNGKDLWEMSYALRDYSKWFAEGYCNAGFLGNNDRYVAPDVAETPEPDTWAKNKERQKVDSAFEADFKETQKAYATIRIFKDGSIVLMDAYGSAIHLAGGNIQLSAAKNLSINCSNVLNLVAKEISMTGTDSVTVSSTNGTLDLASKYLSRLSSTKGMTIVESTMADKGDLETYATEKKDDRIKTLIKQAKLKEDSDIASVIINAADSKKGNLLINAGLKAVIYSKSILQTCQHYIVNPLKSFAFKNYFKGTSNKLYVLSESIFKLAVKTLTWFYCKQSRKINTMAPEDINPDGAKVVYEEGMSEENLESATKLDEKFLGDDITEDMLKTPTKQISTFKYKKYKASKEITLAETLTDQFFGKDGMLPDNYQEKVESKKITDDVFKIGKGAEGFPYPATDIKMKKYSPQCTWNTEEAGKKSGKDFKLNPMMDTIYGTYLKKDD